MSSIPADYLHNKTTPTELQSELEFCKSWVLALSKRDDVMPSSIARWAAKCNLVRTKALLMGITLDESHYNL